MMEVIDMSLTLVHDEREGTAASEARLIDDGIEAMLEHRDRLLRLCEGNYPEPLKRAMQAKADDLSAEAGIQRFRLLAFMLANNVTSGDLLLAGAR